MSRNTDIVGKLFPNKADKDLFDTLFYSDDGLPLLKILRKKDSEGNIYFEFQVDGANNNYATQDDVDEKIAALGRVLTYKGSVESVDTLPAEGNTAGDVYYVKEVSAEYVWIVDDNVGSWEELGPDMPSNKMYMYSLYIDELSTNENEEISVYFSVISKDPNLFVSDSDTIVKENNFKTLCENYSGVYFTAGGNVAFDDTGENKTVSYIKVNKDPKIYRLSIRFNDGTYYNKTIINNKGEFVEFAGLLSCGVKVEI